MTMLNRRQMILSALAAVATAARPVLPALPRLTGSDALLSMVRSHCEAAGIPLSRMINYLPYIFK